MADSDDKSVVEVDALEHAPVVSNAFKNLTARFGAGPKKRSWQATDAPSEASKKKKKGDIKRRVLVSKGGKSGSAKRRFPDMTEEEVLKLKLPDHLALDLDVIFCGINPGLQSAYKGHHYGNPANHFWRCIHEAGFTPTLLPANRDHECVNHGFGLTNIVERTTRSSADLSKTEVQLGAQALRARVRPLNPLVVCFVGKGIYEVFSGRKCKLGLQQATIGDIKLFVVPSTSARVSHFPRYTDKLPFFQELHTLVKHLRK